MGCGSLCGWRGIGLTFTSVSAGRDHVCGATTSAQTYCWGWNGEGELGDGTTTNRLTPVLLLR